MSSGRFERRTIDLRRGTSLYQVWIPAGYDGSREWPAILFLHGAGERGDDGVLQTTVGLGPHLVSGKADAQALVVFPQCPVGSHWIGAAGAIAVAALDAVEREFPVDLTRVSITGISMGGAGVWALAAAEPARWSALAPVCGFVDARTALEPHADLVRLLPPVPVWIFHGEADTVIPVEESRRMAALVGAQARYTEFPAIGHNAWDPAYGGTDVVSWLVQQRRASER